MRKELKNISTEDYWRYGLSERDFDFIFDLTEKFISEREQKMEDQKEDIIKANPNPDIHVEAIADVGHYSWVETQFLWQFCLTRLQGILEGLIVYNYLSNNSDENLFGLKSKLKAVQIAGFSLDKSEYDTLLDWANLRNFLAHAPPAEDSPGPLKKDDVLEYKTFAKGLCERWKEEKSEIN
jgi:hypothetical protein